jgi:uncharacterized protein YerC
MIYITRTYCSLVCSSYRNQSNDYKFMKDVCEKYEIESRDQLFFMVDLQ